MSRNDAKNVHREGNSMCVMLAACLLATALDSVCVSSVLLAILAFLCIAGFVFNEYGEDSRVLKKCERLASISIQRRRRFCFGLGTFVFTAAWFSFFGDDVSPDSLVASRQTATRFDVENVQEELCVSGSLPINVSNDVELKQVAYATPSERAESRVYAPDPERRELPKQRPIFAPSEGNFSPNEEVAPFPLSTVEKTSSELRSVPNTVAVSRASSPATAAFSESATFAPKSEPDFKKRSVLHEFTPARALLPSCFTSKGTENRISSVGYAGRENPANAIQIGVTDSLSFSAEGERSFLEILDEEKAKISDEVRPAVLTINVRRKSETGGYDEAHGSGFAVQYDGRIFVLTNEHVICGASSQDIDITTYEGETFRPIRTLSCPKFDVSALEIDTRTVASLANLKLCRLAESASLRAGSGLFTIGAPLFMDWTLTYCNVGRLYSSVPELKEAGIIKSDENLNNGEVQNDLRDLVRYIQISGVILEGNSGGPLFNVKGDVVGMVTATIQRKSVTTGIGFAIPIEDVLSVVRNMVDSGAWERSYFGVTIDGTTSSEFVKANGVRLAEVIANSPAAQAGVKVNDCVLTFNGERVRNRYDLARLIALAKPGEEGRMEIVRNGRPMSILFTTRSSSRVVTAKSPAKAAGTSILR